MHSARLASDIAGLHRSVWAIIERRQEERVMDQISLKYIYTCL